ncbi:MAG: hypothetical protein AABX59_01950 [Nanoarchaeota archaeon]
METGYKFVYQTKAKVRKRIIVRRKVTPEGIRYEVVVKGPLNYGRTDSYNIKTIEDYITGIIERDPRYELVQTPVKKLRLPKNEFSQLEKIVEEARQKRMQEMMGNNT